MGKYKLSEQEEGFCQDYIAGIDLLTCFRRNYPNDKRSDNKARHQAKMVLQREKVIERIKFLREYNEYDEQSTPETLKKTLLQWTHKFAGRAAGTAAMQILCREAGIGVEKLVIDDQSGIVELQKNLMARRMARLNGQEEPPLLQNVTVEENLEEADFEIEDENGTEASDSNLISYDNSDNSFDEDDDLWED